MSRRRYVWDVEAGCLREVDADFTGAERRAPVATEELTYGGTRATDGADISSRRKLREYLGGNNPESKRLALAGDYTQTWERAATERRAALTPGARHDSAARREAVARAFYDSSNRKR